MKKRYLSLGLAAVMAFSLTACGGSGSSSSESAADSGGYRCGGGWRYGSS